MGMEAAMYNGHAWDMPLIGLANKANFVSTLIQTHAPGGEGAVVPKF